MSAAAGSSAPESSSARTEARTAEAASPEMRTRTARGRLDISGLWLGLTAGRLALYFVHREPDARWLAWAGALAAALVLAGVGTQWTATFALYVATGLALGVVFPWMITLAGRHAPHAAGTAMGWVAGAGGLGGFVIPWVAGALGDWGGVRAAVASNGLWCLALAAAALWAAQAARSHR